MSSPPSDRDDRQSTRICEAVMSNFIVYDDAASPPPPAGELPPARQDEERDAYGPGEATAISDAYCAIPNPLPRGGSLVELILQPHVFLLET